MPSLSRARFSSFFGLATCSPALAWRKKYRIIAALSYPFHDYITPPRRRQSGEQGRGLPFRHAHQKILGAECRGPRRGPAVALAVQRLPGTDVTGIPEQDSGLAIVRQIRVKDFMAH